MSQISRTFSGVNAGSASPARITAPMFCDRDLPMEDTSRECVSLVRMKSLRSSGNTCVLSWSLLNEELTMIL